MLSIEVESIHSSRCWACTWCPITFQKSGWILCPQLSPSFARQIKSLSPVPAAAPLTGQHWPPPGPQATPPGVAHMEPALQGSGGTLSSFLAARFTCGVCVCQQGRGNLRKGPKGVLKGATLLKNEGVFLTWNCIFVYFQVPMILSSYLNLMARWCTARQVKSTGATAVQWRGGCRRWRRNGKIFPPPVSAGTWYREICEHGEPVVERAFSFT